MIDCGLFQGYKALRPRNWEPLPVRARDINAVVLTQAPNRYFITHGEGGLADCIRQRIERNLGWNVTVPLYLDKVSL